MKVFLSHVLREVTGILCVLGSAFRLCKASGVSAVPGTWEPDKGEWLLHRDGMHLQLLAKSKQDLAVSYSVKNGLEHQGGASVTLTL